MAAIAELNKETLATPKEESPWMIVMRRFVRHKLAVFGIEYALRIRKGEATPHDLQTPVDLITAPAK